MLNYKEHSELTSMVIGSAIEVHRELGPGLLESTYHSCLLHELGLKKLNCQSQVHLPVLYKNIELDQGYRIDLIVEETIVLELKVVEKINLVHHAQILTYMKLGNYPIGFLLNFDVVMMKEGIKRFII